MRELPAVPNTGVQWQEIPQAIQFSPMPRKIKQSHPSVLAKLLMKRVQGLVHLPMLGIT